MFWRPGGRRYIGNIKDSGFKQVVAVVGAAHLVGRRLAMVEVAIQASPHAPIPVFSDGDFSIGSPLDTTCFR